MTKPSSEAPYRNPSLPTEERVSDLLGRMTLAEKMGQLIQTPLWSFSDSSEEYREGLRQGRWGSRILAGSAWAGSGPNEPVSREELHEIQRIAVEESRLGIPLLFGRDIIHGQATILPIPLAQAATFNPDLIEAGSHMVAREAASLGVHWTFAPMLDLCRDPRWGRIIEGYGEDPYLISRCGEAVIRGFQGNDLSNPIKLLACAKHFCGYGGSEGGRDYDTTEWSDSTLHNMILPPFITAVRSGVATIMSGFNDLGGTPVSAHRLMQDWLKTEQGFEGFVVSDWGAVIDLIEHGVSDNAQSAVSAALNAGIDMEMIEEAFREAIPTLLAQRAVSEERLDDAVQRVLRIKFQSGLFDNPFPVVDGHLRSPEHREIALKTCEESIVLLQNEGDLLPLKDHGIRVAVVGPFAQAKAQHLGSWCLDGKPEEVTSIVEGFRAEAPDLELLTCDDAFSDELLYVSRKADIVILCVGESACRTGEANSIAELVLPPGQEEMIAAVGRLGIPLIVVQCSGRPIPSPAAHQYAQAWLLAWHGGSEAGTAIARILLGRVEPSGRLPMSMPRSTGQIPIYYNHKTPGKHRQFSSYASYHDVQNGPLFPFGFGLGYSNIQYSPVRLSQAACPADKIEARAEVTITNRGLRRGITVAQLYVRDVVASSTRPCKELRDFRRVVLEPGASQEVSFPLAAQSFSFYSNTGKYLLELGDFLLGIGPDANTELSARFTLTD